MESRRFNHLEHSIISVCMSDFIFGITLFISNGVEIHGARDEKIKRLNSCFFFVYTRMFDRSCQIHVEFYLKAIFQSKRET